MECEPLLARAAAAAETARRKAGVDIRPLATLEEFASIGPVLSSSLEVGRPEELVDRILLTQFVEAGSYVMGAYAEDELVAVSIGFFGRYGGRPSLHSYVTGVVPDVQHRGVGFALKLHQRSWSLEAGAEVVTWTFDPMMSRNSFFNIAKLGAVCPRYIPNLYGRLTGMIYAREEGDCLLACWRLASSLRDPPTARPTLEERLAAGAEVILDVGADPAPATSDSNADVLLCRIPEDVLSLRRREPERAIEWQRALRDTLVARFEAGYEATDFLREGYYVLTPAVSADGGA